ncbi:MAG TPA: PCRF domain-containing protein, partial [Limnobacter sp.]|nr:PCRF domain-containing protein [Limnobacter sp.]
MKDSMRSRLERLTQRLADLDQFLSSQESAQDMVLFKNVTRERSELLPATERYAEYLNLEADLETAQEWLQDPDMRDMAREEIANNERKLTALEADLQRLLLPKDPNDHRNVMLEIRAGTGGDESALFAGDLFRMYTRYAERQGWQIEIMSASESELGGYKEVIVRLAGEQVYKHLKFESGGHRVQR